MRVFLYLCCCLMVLGTGYWAYTENYETRASIQRVDALKRQINEERRAISILKAEWAYLNRPDRLRELVLLNFDDLELLPLLPEHYADVELVPYPSGAPDRVEYNAPVSAHSGGTE